jgi:hypothetical protein
VRQIREANPSLYQDVKAGRRSLNSALAESQSGRETLDSVSLAQELDGSAKARNLIQKPEEIVRFATLTDAQMREIGPLLKKGWTFTAAFLEVIERLTPDDEIRALHTRAVANGGNWCLLSVGNFEHVVVWGAEKDRTLAKVKDTLARPSAPQRF